MQLTTNSSAPSMCCLAQQWDGWCRELKSFWSICLTPSPISFSDRFQLLCPLTDNSPSREAVDDQFQHTRNVLTGITVEQLNAQGQELMIDMLNSSLTCPIDLLFLLTRVFYQIFVYTLVRNPPPRKSLVCKCAAGASWCNIRFWCRFELDLRSYKTRPIGTF